MASDRLKVFEERKAHLLALADQLRKLAREAGDAEAAQVLDEFAQRFRENRFLLMVVGDFKSGKSTLVNALLGRSVCPVRVTPQTAKVTRVAGLREPGGKEVVEVTFKEDRPPERMPLGEKTLDELVAVKGLRTASVRHVDVFLEPRGSLLQHPLRLVDTPGLGSGEDEHSEITRSYIQHADALLFTFFANKPFSESERAFLLAHRPLLERTVFVVNRIDELDSPEDRTLVLDHIRERVRQEVLKEGSPPPTLFPISAREALNAAKAGDAGGLERSGLSALVDAIEERLASEHVNRLLRTVCADQKRVCEALIQKTALAEQALEALSARDDERMQRTKFLVEQMAAGERRARAAIAPLRSRREQAFQEIPGVVQNLRAALVQAVTEWVRQSPSEAHCKQNLPAVLAKLLADRVEALDQGLAVSFKGWSEPPHRELQRIFLSLEQDVLHTFSPEMALKAFSAEALVGSGVEALAGLTALGNSIGGPTGGYGIATEALARALAPSAEVRLFSITAAVSVLLAEFAGPVGWVVAGIAGALAALVGYTRSTTWRARVLESVITKLDEQVLPNVEQALGLAVQNFTASLESELQEWVRKVLQRLHAVMDDVEEELATATKQQARQSRALTARRGKLELLKKDLEAFAAQLPPPPPRAEAEAPPLVGTR